MAKAKQTIFSGIQPSGVFTLGNYLGAIRNWSALQDEYNCYYCVVDLHALTVRQNADELRDRCYDSLAMLLASGLDPEKNTIFCQSYVSAHAELTWVLNCNAYMGELSRMTQFKEKSERHSENINAGLFTYPVLMASDILLYNTDLVPVGADQKQHLELCRDIAIRFNNAYGEVFTIPEAYIPKQGARVMSLQEPEKKMSKSDENANAYISLIDPPELIVKKVKRAVTDSEGIISFTQSGSGVKNLLSIYAACTGKSEDVIEAEFAGKGYGALKAAVADAVVSVLAPIQSEYAKLAKDRAYLKDVMVKGACRAAETANRTLAEVYRLVGLAER